MASRDRTGIPVPRVGNSPVHGQVLDRFRNIFLEARSKKRTPSNVRISANTISTQCDASEEPNILHKIDWEHPVDAIHLQFISETASTTKSNVWVVNVPVSSLEARQFRGQERVAPGRSPNLDRDSFQSSSVGTGFRCRTLRHFQGKRKGWAEGK